MENVTSLFTQLKKLIGSYVKVKVSDKDILLEYEGSLLGVDLNQDGEIISLYLENNSKRYIINGKYVVSLAIIREISEKSQ